MKSRQQKALTKKLNSSFISSSAERLLLIAENSQEISQILPIQSQCSCDSKLVSIPDKHYRIFTRLPKKKTKSSNNDGNWKFGLELVAMAMEIISEWMREHLEPPLAVVLNAPTKLMIYAFINKVYHKIERIDDSMKFVI